MHTALPEGRSGRKASPEDQRETSLTDERGGRTSWESGRLNNCGCNSNQVRGWTCQKGPYCLCSRVRGTGISAPFPLFFAKPRQT